ncbi:MAG TPA: zinc-ribbon domain-containing protein [Tepidisphaeraceae bacterium]|nr:zinc-ribbon domain-containing protein [Tepidisphaeraceae bacterium]
MRRPGRGFILLFGTKPIVSDEPGQPVEARCPQCGREATFHGKSYRLWFTLFFLPVVPVSGKKPLSQCSACDAQFPIPLDELRTRVTQNHGEQNQQAIAMYNSLRSSPSNAITLNELMLLYGSMKEYDQAIAAAGQFPQALHASEQCMTTLGRTYLAKGDTAAAMQWLDAALERNGQLGEASYYKALAYLTATPPEPAKAAQAARAARKAGYPNADDLLRQAEEKSREAGGT